MSGTFLMNYHELEPIEVIGTILASDFDRRGKALEIIIETGDFKQYGIVSNSKSQELFHLIFTNVLIQGSIIGENEQGQQMLKVRKFEILDII